MRVTGAGELLEFGPDEIHRVTCAAGEPAVTIHPYSPALARTGAYSVDPGGVLRRRALDEDTELVADDPLAVA